MKEFLNSLLSRKVAATGGGIGAVLSLSIPEKWKGVLVTVLVIAHNIMNVLDKVAAAFGIKAGAEVTPAGQLVVPAPEIEEDLDAVDA